MGFLGGRGRTDDGQGVGAGALVLAGVGFPRVAGCGGRAVLGWCHVHPYTGQRPGFRVPGCRFGVVDVASRRCAPPPPPRPEPEPEPEPEEERDCGWKPCFLSDAVDRVGDAAGAVGEFVDEHKVEILTEVALTAVSFVPVAGPVVRVGMLVHRGMSASRVARAVAPVTSRVGSVASRVGSAGRRGPDLGGCVAGAANSFDGATLVLMADGTKPISEVEVGDLVLATDPETGRTEAREVTDLIVGEGVKSMVAVTVDGPGPDDGVLMATAKHPFWDAADREWVDATDLANGDLLLAPDGDLLPVGGIRESTRIQTVYNLTVADIHTYYVLAGHEPILVHNATVDQKCNVILPGPNAREGVALVNGRLTGEVRDLIDEAGARYGCHSCFAQVPGTPSGRWIPDHQPSTSLVRPGTPQTAFPHCRACSYMQGGIVTTINRGGRGF